jgi:glycosyltransferase involved in cell wall biosynthesis
LNSGRLLPITNPERAKYDVGNLVHKTMVFRRARRAATRAIRDRGIEVVHVHQYPLHLVAGLAARAAGVPCLWHWHGAKSRRRLARATVSVAMRALATHVACISDFVRSSLPPGGRPKSSVVYNGVRTAAIREGQRPGALRERLDLPPDQALVAIVGSLTEYKGHRYFIQAAARVLERFPHVRFLVIGGETAVQRRRFGLEARWRQLARDCGVAEGVIFCGELPDAAMYFCDCDIICLPSVPIGIAGEGFGLTVVEAMAAGVAVVATDCGGPREIVEHGRSGLLVPPKDDAALAEALVSLLQDRERRAAMARAGQQRAAMFDIARTAAALENLYGFCAASRRPRADAVAAGSTAR